MAAMPTGPKRAAGPESYRESLARAAALEREIAHGLEHAASRADVRAVEAGLAEMEQQIDRLDQLRSTMSERDRFMALFSVKTLHDGVISLVIPEGVPRIRIIEQANCIVKDLWGKGAVWSPVLKRWQQMAEFCEPLPRDEPVILKGCVEGTPGMPPADQAALLAARGFEPVTPWDVAVAHASYTVARNDNLFGWCSRNVSFRARTIYGTLRLEPYGLSDLDFTSLPHDEFTMMPGKLPSS